VIAFVDSEFIRWRLNGKFVEIFNIFKVFLFFHKDLFVMIEIKQNYIRFQFMKKKFHRSSLRLACLLPSNQCHLIER